MASLTFRWDSASVGKLSRLINRISKAQAFADNREHFLIRPMKDEQVSVWARNFPAGGRYGDHAPLSDRAIANRIRRGFPTSPPLLRSGRTKTFFLGDAGRGVVSKGGVNWGFRDYIMKSDDSAMVVKHNRTRPFVDLNNQDRELHEKRAELWLAQLARTVTSG